MDKPFYDFRIEDDACQFSFTSTGPHPVNKLVLYSATYIPNLYNLSLADVEADGRPNYNSVRNNGDLTQLMATVAQTMLAFFERHPQALVAFSGNTPSHTRLYQYSIGPRTTSGLQTVRTFRLTRHGLGSLSAEPAS